MKKILHILIAVFCVFAAFYLFFFGFFLHFGRQGATFSPELIVYSISPAQPSPGVLYVESTGLYYYCSSQKNPGLYATDGSLPGYKVTDADIQDDGYMAWYQNTLAICDGITLFRFAPENNSMTILPMDPQDGLNRQRAEDVRMEVVADSLCFVNADNLCYPFYPVPREPFPRSFPDSAADMMVIYNGVSQNEDEVTTKNAGEIIPAYRLLYISNLQILDQNGKERYRIYQNDLCGFTRSYFCFDKNLLVGLFQTQSRSLSTTQDILMTIDLETGEWEKVMESGKKQTFLYADANRCLLYDGKTKTYRSVSPEGEIRWESDRISYLRPFAKCHYKLCGDKILVFNRNMELVDFLDTNLM